MGGFGASSTDVHVHTLNNVLTQNPKYRVVNAVPHISVELVDEYKTVCRVVAEYEKVEPKETRKLTRALLSDVHWRGVERIPAEILFTAKTHKTRGENKPRVVHGSRRGPFVPLKRRLCFKIQNQMEGEGFEHILKDSVEFCKFV